jgi:lysophospholipase L1-like esterase
MDGAKPGNFYVADGIHLTPAGYRRWTPALNAALSRELGAAACGD